MEPSLDELSTQLHHAYLNFKEAEKAKNEAREAFFEALDEQVGKDKPYQFMNHKDNMVYTRSVATGYELDDERLKEEDPELWVQITEVAYERRLKKFEELTDDQLANVQQYMVEKQQVKLLPPREASDEEINGNL